MRLALRTDTGTVYICDEYNPTDGRVHILNNHKYGTFDRDSMDLEFLKVGFPIDAVLYEGVDWPADAQSSSLSDLIAYFSQGTSQ